MDSLLERIEENTLDALYLFINETLRDRQTFDIFFENLMSLLPQNWSIQRVEVGHEFLSMVHVDNNNQLRLFETIASLEAIKTLIISDGYVPRKDKGSINTEAFLTALPNARNLINLDIHRLSLQDLTQVDMLSDALESMQESLEEIRMTGLFLSAEITNLDPAIKACVDMGHLRSLAMTCLERNSTSTTTTTTRNNHRPAFTAAINIAAANANNANANANNNANNANIDDDGDGVGQENNNDNAPPMQQQQQHQQQPVQQPPSPESQKSIISCDCLLELCQRSSSLQDLSLRAMNVDDDTCQTIAKALKKNLFLTTLDLRQNPQIRNTGCRMILEALERNYDLWCTVMVDNESFQGRFNSLIELNQANRGDLIRNPTLEKLITFLNKLKDDPTALWYFWTIHDTILYPFIAYLKWKKHKEQEIEERKKKQPPPAVAVLAAAFASSSSHQKRKSEDEDAASLLQLKLPPQPPPAHQQPMMMIHDASATSTTAASVPVVAINTTTSVAAAAAALPPPAVSPLFASDPSAVMAQQQQFLYSASSSAATWNNKRRRTSVDSDNNTNLADEVAAILARNDAANASIAAEVQEMDSRAVEEEVQAILAAQRQQQGFMY